MTSTMVLAISTASSSFLHYSSSTGVKTSSHCFFSNSAISIPKKAIVQQINCISQLRFTSSSQWNGLKYTGISISQYPTKIERKGKCKGKVVCASLFGVGAPEIMVIGVVALLVFGPKGLAEVARNLGKTLRTFQPTLRELQEVSREFKSTLEREIGLDDIDNPVPKSPSPTKTKPASSENTPEPNGSSSENGEDSIDDALKVKADLFRGALAQLQKEQEEEREKEKARSEAESQTPSQDTSQDLETPEEASSVTVTPPPSQNPDNAFQEAPAPKGETQI